jgi:hypothetical protein
MEEEQAIVGFILDFYQAYNRPPDQDELLSEFPTDEIARKIIISVYDRIDEDEELDFAEERAITFAKQQAAKIATLDSIKDIERGTLSNIIPRFEKALEVGQDLTNLGLDFKAIESWLELEEETEKLTTGIPLLDDSLDGGLGRGEYGIVLAATNVGKTMMLVNIGFGAMDALGRHNVTHVTLEMNAKAIARRYAARTVDQFFNVHTDSVVKYIEDFKYMAHMRLFGQLRIKGWPSGQASVADIKTYVNRLEMNGFPTDVLIVDYPEIMRHANMGELRHNISNTTIQLRGLADGKKLALWGAAQTNRGGLNTEIVDLGDVSEDYGQMKHSDVVIAMSQTKDELREGLLRIYGAKCRSSSKGWQIRCKQHHEGHAIIGIDMIDMSDFERERVERAEQEEAMLKLARMRDERKDNGN